MNIEAMAKGIKATDKVFTVTGYADKGTGSAEYNMKLSKKRAEAVRDPVSYTHLKVSVTISLRILYVSVCRLIL